MKKLRFRILNKNPLYDYREACKITQGIDLWEDLDLNKIFKPKDEVEFWIKQIVANHSCIRTVSFRIVDKRPKSVIMQLIRATKGRPIPEVQSSRPDWNGGKERSSDPYEEKLYMHQHTAESFIEMARQRLCNRTEERTRKTMEEMVDALKRSKEPFLKAVGYCCHPYCWWYSSCPEIRSCGAKTQLSRIVIADYLQSENKWNFEAKNEK